MHCTEIEESLALYLYDELTPEQRQDFETHLATCAACGAKLEETRRLHHVLSGHPSPEPSPQLLAHCRVALEDALDRELAGMGWKSLFEQWASAFGGMSRLPIAAALTLVVLGFSLGWTLRPRSAGLRSATNQESLNPLGDTDLGNLRINAISQVSPSPNNGDVRITVNAERQMTLEGSLDDPRIRQVLVDAVKGYDDPGIRRDSMEMLSRHSDNPAVRSAMLFAIQNDRNVGVRLDALAAVQSMDWTPEVRQALLNTLEHDKNPGVRVAAIDVVAGHADQAALPVLARLAAGDPNRYVRMKSLNAVRKLEGE